MKNFFVAVICARKEDARKKFNLFIGTEHKDGVTVYFIAGATGKKLNKAIKAGK